jgi:hypothetical protein
MRGFAEHLGVALRTVAKWEERAEEIQPRPPIQEVLDTALRLAPAEAQQRFHEIIGNDEDTPANAKIRSANTEPDAKLGTSVDKATVTWLQAVEERQIEASGSSVRHSENLDFALFIDHAGTVWADNGRRKFILGTLSLAAANRSLFAGDITSASALDPLFVDTAFAVWPGQSIGNAGRDFELGFAPSGIFDGARLRIQQLDMRDEGQGFDLPDMYLSTDHAAAQVRITDARRMRRQITDSATRVGVPSAYRLDAFTAGIIRAVANLDQALRSDDAAITAARRRLVRYGRSEASEVGREAADELGLAGQAWIGSRFCAGHIRQHLRQLSDHPAFWTCEQRGDEASTWLFFTHKQQYLRQTVDTFGPGLTRAFCIPENVLDVSAADRVLLFLVFAQMEASGVRVVLSSDQAYANVEGFVLSGKKAVVANWVRSDGLWHVDTVGSSSVVRTFDTAMHDAQTDNLVPHENPYDRLAALAEYLRLDWVWLVQRSTELARHGCANLITPRSRLLALDGLEQALTFVARAPRTTS